MQLPERGLVPQKARVHLRRRLSPVRVRRFVGHHASPQSRRRLCQTNGTGVAKPAGLFRYVSSPPEVIRRHGSPEVNTADGLRGYGAAMAELGCREKQVMERFDKQAGGEQPPAVWLWMYAGGGWKQVSRAGAGSEVTDNVEALPVSQRPSGDLT